jgi:predicted aspartyl protease
MRTIHFLAALPLTCLFTGLFAGGAFAQACTKPLALANSIQMESTDGGPSLVPVKINGTDHKLTLATAATSTTISEDTIKALNLDPKRAAQVMVDDAGNEYRDEVTLADFNLGRMHGANVKWPVGGGRGGRGGRGSRGGGGGFGGGSGGDGQLGQNYLRVYDLDVDFGSDKLQFFAQDHCPGGVMYWKAPGAVGVLPITIENGRIYVPMMLDGKAIRGVIDTAARNTTVYAAVAQRLLGVELGGAKAPADNPSRGFGGQSYTWTVGSLSFNALALKDQPIMVQPDVANAGANQGFSAVNRKLGIESELASANVRLGMDVLRKLHLYFAWGENKLYVTGTTNTLPATAAAAPAKAP